MRVPIRGVSLAALSGIALAVLALALACGGNSPRNNSDAGTDEKPDPTRAAATLTAISRPVVEQLGTDGTIVATKLSGYGTVVTTSDGMTLYSFTGDVVGSGISACEAGCQDTWPPLIADGTPTAGSGVKGDIGTITRSDGSSQITYKGKPLYRYANDHEPGDVNGAGVAGQWRIVIP